MGRQCGGYRNSRRADNNVWSANRQVTDLTAVLLDQIAPIIAKKRFHQRKYEANLRAIALNLYVAYRADPTMYVAYSRGRSDYVTSRYTPAHVSYGHYVKVVDALETTGFLEGKKGYFDRRSGKARLSRMRATRKLAGMFDAYNLSRYMVSRHPNEEVILLRDTDKNLIDYTDTDETRRMRECLNALNAYLIHLWIDLHAPDEVFQTITERLREDKDDSPIDFTRTPLRRVFNNGSFEQGGRFYNGWWQGVPREHRKYIQIQGRETIEEDFSGMHIRMLYAQAGLPLPEDDSYTIDGIDRQYRDTIKKALNTMINAKSREDAEGVIKHCKLPPSVSAAALMDTISEKHAPIARFFNTGEGVRLQYRDSQIAEKVMMDLYEQGIPCLCVHDSFIVQRASESALHAAMDNAFHEVLGIPARRDTKITREQWEVWDKEGRPTESPSQSPAVEARDKFYREQILIKGYDTRLDYSVPALYGRDSYAGYWQRHGEFEEAHGTGSTGLSPAGTPIRTPNLHTGELQP